MTWLELLALLGAGAAAGLINTVVGSGTLVTFPVLLAFGVPPVVANISNTVGLAPGSLSGALATRADLVGQRTRVLRLGARVLGRRDRRGGVAAAAAVVGLRGDRPGADRHRLRPGHPAAVAVPPAGRAARRTWTLRRRRPTARSGCGWASCVTGVYGGYFGAAQGVLLLAILGIGLAESMDRINAVKNVLALIVNGVAGLLFVLLPLTPWANPEARVNWPAALAIAVGCGARRAARRPGGTPAAADGLPGGDRRYRRGGDRSLL